MKSHTVHLKNGKKLVVTDEYAKNYVEGVRMKALIMREFIGKRVKITLKEGGVFFINIQEYGIDYISGFDDERINIKVMDDDIKEITWG